MSMTQNYSDLKPLCLTIVPIFPVFNIKMNMLNSLLKNIESFIVRSVMISSREAIPLMISIKKEQNKPYLNKF